MQQKIITLFSDFGLKDPCVAEMKVVILDKYPEAKILDVSHEVDKFDVQMGFHVCVSGAIFSKGHGACSSC